MQNLAALKAKTNARYICQECGSTELIQAHHETPGDDTSLVVLCAECHSKKHPGVPRALFFSKNNQPYWHNKSASSIAKQLDIHPRTVIRAARKLKIAPGELSPWDDWLLRVNIPKMRRQKLKKVKLNNFTLPTKNCLRCGHKWVPKKEHPRVCPKCLRTHFDIPPDMKRRLRVHSKQRVVYLPKDIVDQGLSGDVDGYANAVTLTLVNPTTPLDDIRFRREREDEAKKDTDK